MFFLNNFEKGGSSHVQNHSQAYHLIIVIPSQMLGYELLEIYASVWTPIFSSLSTLVSMPIGNITGHRFDHIVIPLIVGLFILSRLSNIIICWTESRKGNIQVDSILDQ